MKRGPSASVKLAVFSLLIFANSLPLSAQTWERLGPPGGMVISLASDSGDTLYLGTNDGHVFVSQDRGGHWSLRGRVGLRTDAIVAQLAVNPREPKQVFAPYGFRKPVLAAACFAAKTEAARGNPRACKEKPSARWNFLLLRRGCWLRGRAAACFVLWIPVKRGNAFPRQAILSCATWIPWPSIPPIRKSSTRELTTCPGTPPTAAETGVPSPPG